MARIKFSVDMKRFDRDLKRVQRQLKALEKRAIKQADEGMRQEAKAILNRARDLTPVKTGRLRDSGRLRETEKAGGKGKEFEISFNTPYALAVHERTDLKHPRGRAKFLETAGKEAARGLARRVATKISKVIKTPKR